MPNLLSEAADNYFKSLNPIAEKIAEEIQSVKAACTEWHDLTITEQEQILNDSIIHPQTLLQYSLTLQNIYGKSGCYFENGLKTVIDEQTVRHLDMKDYIDTSLYMNCFNFSVKCRVALGVMNTQLLFHGKLKVCWNFANPLNASLLFLSLI